MSHLIKSKTQNSLQAKRISLEALSSNILHIKELEAHMTRVHLCRFNHVMKDHILSVFTYRAADTATLP